MTARMIRQGDVLLRPVTAARDDAGNVINAGEKVDAENGRLVLARGERTGHYHSLPFGGAYLYRDSQGSMLLDVQAPSKLEHLVGLAPTGEHAALDVPAGAYNVIQQHGLSPDQAPDTRVWD